MKSVFRIWKTIYIMILVFSALGSVHADNICPRDAMMESAQCTRPVQTNIGCAIWDMSYKYRSIGYKVASCSVSANNETAFTYTLHWKDAGGTMKTCDRTITMNLGTDWKITGVGKQGDFKFRVDFLGPPVVLPKIGDPVPLK